MTFFPRFCLVWWQRGFQVFGYAQTVLNSWHFSVCRWLWFSSFSVHFLFPLWLFWLNWCLLCSTLLITCFHIAEFRGLNVYSVPILQLFIIFFQYALKLQSFQRISLELFLTSFNLLKVALQVCFLCHSYYIFSCLALWQSEMKIAEWQEE